MPQLIELLTPADTMEPVGPYSHISKVGGWITIAGTAGVNPATGVLAGPDITSQTNQIFDTFEIMLGSVGSDLDHVVHINVFLLNMDSFEQMNSAYAQRMGRHRPARTTIGVSGLPKKGALLTMNLTGVVSHS